MPIFGAEPAVRAAKPAHAGQRGSDVGRTERGASEPRFKLFQHDASACAGRAQPMALDVQRIDFDVPPQHAFERA